MDTPKRLTIAMLKFQQLSAFKAVYELGTMTAAAEQIHITQPAISRLIASLEHQLSFPLFERIKGRLVPTARGKAFYFEVSKAFFALDSLEESARDIGTCHHGSLHITAFPMLSNSFLPALLGRFLKAAGSLSASLKSYRSEEVLRRTEIQSCDIGFALVDGFSPGPSVQSRRLEGDCVCIVPADSPLALKSSLCPEDLASAPLIRYEQDDSTQQALDQLLERHGVRCHDLLEVSFANVAATLVSEGVGVAAVDPFTALHAQQSQLNIAVRPFEPGLPFQFHLLFPSLRPISPTALAFSEFFLSEAAAAGIALRMEPS
ncbi:LysR substrate-binding domain-containing protein [Aestuariirhabdus litorea]|uniref:LysR family transcriptional regulator n=1 Tax=Aestuariirhabdus litorea TaxID=2528527 RepID=A0A3P3VR36_9GAMM|nr:LysR substrate-binding domain-containing protein [Aestuariirhabdus litorea]RRJ83989.1 LysR family transcriptional regulator [Aestuariirhabdus litorea]RWW97209.1 LysR family transcriptional regulator [Endozoicomonadaceae bacterium GTF-13]